MLRLDPKLVAKHKEKWLEGERAAILAEFQSGCVKDETTVETKVVLPEQSGKPSKKENTTPPIKEESHPNKS